MFLEMNFKSDFKINIKFTLTFQHDQSPYHQRPQDLPKEEP